MINNNNNNKTQQPKPKLNTIVSPKDLKNRFCTVCHIQLVFDETHNIYKCQRCGCQTVIGNTEPAIKIRPTFPVFDQTQPNKKHIFQSDNERLSRSQQFIKKRQEERNQLEVNDPYMVMLKNKSEIRITNTEYYSVEDSYQQYDQ